MSRKSFVDEFYQKLKDLNEVCGGKRKLKNCNGRMNWPNRGIYFFFEKNEFREKSEELRVTRIGTHAVSAGSKTTIWNRLRTHRGPFSGKYKNGGNHRASIFRLEVGKAIIQKEGLENKYPEWGVGSSASSEVRKIEHPLEKKVSEYIRNLPFLWLEVDDEPGPDSMRAYLEENSIALLSNLNKVSVDSRNGEWLGKYSPKSKIRKSGLWNSDHVDENFDSYFLERMDNFLKKMK